jgi:hypothetical protein
MHKRRIIGTSQVIVNVLNPEDPGLKIYRSTVRHRTLDNVFVSPTILRVVHRAEFAIV